MSKSSNKRTQNFSILKPVKIGGRKILDVSTEISVTTDPETLAALTSDQPLDPARDPVRITTVKLDVSTGRQSVDFDWNDARVSFRATGDTQTGLGIYRQYSDMLDDIADFSGKGNKRIPFDTLPFPDVPASRYFALYWSYRAENSAAGSLALDPGLKLDSGIKDATYRGFYLIRAYQENPPAFSAVKNLFGNSWILPGQVHSPDDLEPGTWIVAEVAGSFHANLGMDLGFDYNWIRSIKKDAAEVFEGDIGLKIQTGLTAVFRLQAGGRFIMIVGRDSLHPEDRVIRVRLHRLNQKNWSFAIQAALDGTESLKKIDAEKLDDFIAAILGIHGLQILEEIRQWTVPGQRTSDLTAAFLIDYAQNQLGEDFERHYEKIHRRVVTWFEKWGALPVKAASALWDIVRSDRNSVENFVAFLKNLSDPDTTEMALQSILADIPCASTPAGKWYSGLQEERIHGVLSGKPEEAAIRTAARTTLDIIDDKLLDTLKNFTENAVGFPAVHEAVRRNDFQSLGDTAKKKLAQFLGKKTPIDMEDFQKVRETVHRLLSRGADLYRSGIDALEESYRPSFDFACSESEDQTTLLDVCFDFGSNSELGPELEKAVAGDFTGVLPAPGQPVPEGVTFREAALTHRIQRQAHVRIRLPYFTSETKHRTSSLASFTLISEQGNMYFYSLDADDETRESNRWASTLSLCMSLALAEKSEIRRYDRNGSKTGMDYRFVQAIPELRASQLERFLIPIFQLYFKNRFAESDSADEPVIQSWTAALENASGRQAMNRDRSIGNSLVTLDVSLPGAILLEWLHAPPDVKNPVYMDMSRRFQSLWRRFVPLLYFQNPKNFMNLDVAWPLLVYASLPVTTSIRADKGALHFNTDRELYWDWPDEKGDRRLLVSSKAATDTLRRTLRDTKTLLAGTPGLESFAGFYDPEIKISAIRSSIADNPGKFLLECLLYTEATIIRSAAQAGREIARFQSETVNPPAALRVLARFGSDLTRTFNSRLKTLFHPGEPAGRHILKNLGLLVFSEITGSLNPQSDVRPAAALEIIVLKDEEIFPPKGFPSRHKIRADAIRAQQRITTDGTATGRQR